MESAQRHSEFNRWWIKRNFELVVPGIRYMTLELFRNMQFQTPATKTEFTSAYTTISYAGSGMRAGYHTIHPKDKLVPMYGRKRLVSRILKMFNPGYRAHGITVV
jgi:hypothetical protein